MLIFIILNAFIIHELLMDHQRNYVTQVLNEERAAITHCRVCQRHKANLESSSFPVICSKERSLIVYVY